MPAAQSNRLGDVRSWHSSCSFMVFRVREASHEGSFRTSAEADGPARRNRRLRGSDGRIVPSWNDDELRLTIEPAGGAAVRTTVFERASGGGGALDRGTSTRNALTGTYRATLHATGGKEVGWLSVDIDPEGATQFSGDL